MSLNPSPTLTSPSTLPLVTVAILSYNHEPFIEQAVASVLAQQTTFSTEILLADDCSTDRTGEILNRLQASYPERLIRLQRARNLGLSANLQDCRDQARGRFLAILEGDDVWTDCLKLQKQADALTANPDWSMCFSACRVFSEDGSQKDSLKPFPFPDRTLVVDDFLAENQIQTMSVAMFRQGIVRSTPDWHAKLRIGDWALYVLHAIEGPIGFVPSVTTDYRVHGAGLWSGLGSVGRFKQIDALFGYLSEHFDGELSKKFQKSRDQTWNDFDARVRDLEKVERRYQLLQLDHLAAACRRLREMISMRP